MRKKLLLVDDDLELLDLLRLHFKEESFSITVTGNGTEALKKARQIVPDLIVLDLMLPELDGFAVCEHLRRHPATASIPVIVLSSAASELSRLAGLECGATDAVSKPVNPKVFIERIGHWLKQPPAPRRVCPTPKARPLRFALCPE